MENVRLGIIVGQRREKEGKGVWVVCMRAFQMAEPALCYQTAKSSI